VRSSQTLKANRQKGDRQGRGDFDGGHGSGPGWIWGLHAGLAVLGNPARKIERVIASRNAQGHLQALVAKGLKIEVLEPDAIDRMMPPGAVHQGMAVRAQPLEVQAIEDACGPADGRPVLVLDQITDPQNVGALFRSAAAFNARAVVLQDRKAPPLTGALAKAAAGAIETVAEVRVVNIARAVEQLGEMGYHTVALAGDGRETIGQAVRGAAQCALVLGAEGKGLRPLVAERCLSHARIDIAPAMESLNVSVAGAIALYAISMRT
jgi:23S rRNA (guanosine2251-2'-O)-methyltransferase